MSKPTNVNSQITDAIAQANTKVPSDAPAENIIERAKTVNDQITDAVTQVNTKDLHDVSSTSLENIKISTSQALQNAAHNATTGQTSAEETAQAALTQGISTLYGVDTASTGTGTEEIFTKKKK